MRVNSQAGESFDLRDDPARFLAAGDFISKSYAAAILRAQADGVHRLSLSSALLSAGDGNQCADVGDRKALCPANAENARRGSEFTIADADSRGPQNDVEHGKDQEHIEEAEYQRKKPRSARMEKKINDARPYRCEDKKKERAGWRAKSGKVKFRATGL